MSNLDNMKKLILEDGKMQAERILQEASDKAEEEKKAILDQARKEKEKLIQAARERAPQLKETIEAGGRRQARDEVLQAKQELIDRVMLLAKKELSNLSEADYAEFIHEALKSKTWNSDITIQIPSKKNFSHDRYKVEKMDGLKDGFAIIDGDVRYSYGFDALVDSLRDTMEIEILKLTTER